MVAKNQATARATDTGVFVRADTAIGLKEYLQRLIGPYPDIQARLAEEIGEIERLLTEKKYAGAKCVAARAVNGVIREVAMRRYKFLVRLMKDVPASYSPEEVTYGEWLMLAIEWRDWDSANYFAGLLIAKRLEARNEFSR